MTGEQLKQRIKNAGVPLAEVARKLNIKPQTLQKRLKAASVKSDFQEAVIQIIGEENPTINAGMYVQQNNNGDNGLALAINEPSKQSVKERAYKSEIERLKSIIKKQEDEIVFLRKAILGSIEKIGRP